ncbi:hypothetical protein IQ22_02334 [Pseudomonas duriflava]|uniref:Uncharacterized protein n=1 Tax=Pseudomonas duriflava TaxID=459528 RepID=A0A562QAI9_9PSED|nr:hypothetical protein [Pseudomonas duriflava]TWI53729.1 hypothetical protein IQ22_02334 [Pseudomonas duriflava]
MNDTGNLVITYEAAGEKQELAIPNAPTDIDESTALLYVLQQHGAENIDIEFPPYCDELNKRRLRAQKMNLLNVAWHYR